MLKKAMIYLGLGPDEHYERYDDPIRPAGGHGPAPPGPARTVQPMGVSVTPSQDSDHSMLGQTVRPVQTALDEGHLHEVGQQPPAPRRVVHAMEPKNKKPYAVSPEAFNDAQEIGDRFKSGQPVIVNLQTVDRDLRRRLVDFSSGLCYAMGGKMDRVADQVYLLTPAEVEVAAAPTRRATPR